MVDLWPVVRHVWNRNGHTDRRPSLIFGSESSATAKLCCGGGVPGCDRSIARRYNANARDDSAFRVVRRRLPALPGADTALPARRTPPRLPRYASTGPLAPPSDRALRRRRDCRRGDRCCARDRTAGARVALAWAGVAHRSVRVRRRYRFAEAIHEARRSDRRRFASALSRFQARVDRLRRRRRDADAVLGGRDLERVQSPRQHGRAVRRHGTGRRSISTGRVFSTMASDPRRYTSPPSWARRRASSSTTPIRRRSSWATRAACSSD